MKSDSPAPGPRAAAILLAVTVGVGFVVWLLAERGVRLGPAWAVTAHGLIAVVLAWRWRLPWWWRLIVALFAPLVVVALVLQPPVWIWPATLLLFVLVFWSVFRTRVPLYLSGPAEWQALAGVLPAGPFALLDIGSGLGGPLFWLARRRPDGAYTGIEIAPLPWLAGWLRARCAPAPRPCMRLGDATRIDLRTYDVVFAFLSPAAMPDLFAKARLQMRPGSVLVSCAFAVPGHEPDQRVSVLGGRELLVWKMG